MRVTGGRACGLKISIPPGRGIRPTSDRVREALFQILSVKFDFNWEGKRVLDLFAGSGALGIEALSRGAADVIFVDVSARALAGVKNNLDLTGFTRSAVLLKADIRSAGLMKKKLFNHCPFDLILADPPYSKGLGGAVTTLVEEMPLLSPGGWLVIEEFSCAELPEQMNFDTGRAVLEEIRTYGQTSVFMYRAVA